MKKKKTESYEDFAVTVNFNDFKKQLSFIDQLSKVIALGDSKASDLVLVKTTKTGISMEFARGGLYAKLKTDATILGKGGFVIPFPYLTSIRGRKKEVTLSVSNIDKEDMLCFKSGVTKGEIKVSKKYDSVENAIPENKIKCKIILNPKTIKDNVNKVVFNTYDPHIDKGIGLPIVIKGEKKSLSMTSNDKFCASKINISTDDKVDNVLITLQATIFDLILKNCESDKLKIGKDDSSTKFLSERFTIIAPTQDLSSIDFDEWVVSNIDKDSKEAEVTFDTENTTNIIEDVSALSKVVESEPTVLMVFSPDKMKTNVKVESAVGKTTSSFKIKKMTKNGNKTKKPIKIKVTGYLLEEFLKIMSKNKTTVLDVYTNLVVIKDTDNNFNYIIPLLT